MTVRVHQLVTGNLRSGGTETLRLFGDVDGQPLFPPGAQPSHGRTVTVTPVKSADGAIETYEFTITNLGIAEDIYDENGNVVDTRTGGLVSEDGDGTNVHTIALGLGVHGTAFGQPTGYKVATWVWDTTEVPGGITFNPATPAAATVAANMPVQE